MKPMNVLSFKSHDESDLVNYQFSVSEELKPGQASDHASSVAKNISGRSAEGAIAGRTDTYVFSGNVTDISLTGPGTIYINDTKIEVLTVDGVPEFTSSATIRTDSINIEDSRSTHQ